MATINIRLEFDIKSPVSDLIDDPRIDIVYNAVCLVIVLLRMGARLSASIINIASQCSSPRMVDEGAESRKARTLREASHLHCEGSSRAVRIR